MCRNKYKVLKENDFMDRVFKDKPEEIKDNNYLNSLYEEMEADKKSRKTVKVLHMSDVHFDYEYFEGKNGNCG